ncbi:MAG TPA: glycosyltransferase [Aquabacterium sp.]|uniref:glycosyltransferase n=1 Tax=Aquabacterium sp. TaxID=1872578 RepID=UPI002E36680E|nr:glycosyltransferase [Aquabacterium sp.]HEX5355554.1 glycosyltransferase [Aquabacterium sp.]
MIDIVSATRLSPRDFWAKSALGKSLTRLTQDKRVRARIAFSNRKGLPEIYNSRINAPDAQDVLLFVHDDVWLDDAQLVDRLLEGLERYDVIGVAGNRRRVPFQPAWLFLDMQFTWDTANLSGAVGHGQQAHGQISAFGDTPADCELLDGVFLAARTHTLRSRSVAFDQRFKFHMYDMDFCRTARQQGLRLGTWPIAITHQSEGAFATPSWSEQLRAYLEKWES